MTLHEAILDVLRDAQRPMRTSEIAREVNARGTYRRHDNGPVPASQVSARTKNYPHLFDRIGGALTIKGAAAGVSDEVSASKTQPTEPAIEYATTSAPPAAEGPLSTEGLLSGSDFRPAGEIDALVPDKPGLYAIRIAEHGELPTPFDALLTARGHDLLYIGVASQNLRKRFLGQELRARGHGTFFRSIGAVLGFRPEAGSLNGKANKRNYTFSAADEARIIEWINANLIVSWIEYSSSAQRRAETALIRTELPLLNIAGNPASLRELSAARAECVAIANAQ